MRLAPQIREKREKRKEKRYCVACRRWILWCWNVPAEINQRFREEWLGNAACAADKREERKEKREEIRNRLSATDF